MLAPEGYVPDEPTPRRPPERASHATRRWGDAPKDRSPAQLGFKQVEQQQGNQSGDEGEECCGNAKEKRVSRVKPVRGCAGQNQSGEKREGVHAGVQVGKPVKCQSQSGPVKQHPAFWTVKQEGQEVKENPVRTQIRSEKRPSQRDVPPEDHNPQSEIEQKHPHHGLSENRGP